MRREYLGDSVYVDYDGHGLTLTTDNGYGPSNTIFLEPAVWRRLKMYVERLARTPAPAETPDAETQP